VFLLRVACSTDPDNPTGVRIQFQVRALRRGCLWMRSQVAGAGIQAGILGHPARRVGDPGNVASPAKCRRRSPRRRGGNTAATFPLSARNAHGRTSRT
jgi:hypothetical protein